MSAVKNGIGENNNSSKFFSPIDLG